jgi:hypothetical protein
MKVLREIMNTKNFRSEGEKDDQIVNYITDKVVVAKPRVSCFESLCSNRASSFANALACRQSNGFLFVNISGKKFEFVKTGTEVYNVSLSVNSPLPLHLYLRTVLYCLEYLQKNPDKVIAIHSEDEDQNVASLVCAILVSSGACQDGQKARDFYLKKSMMKNMVPSQVRYLSYFDGFSMKGIRSLNFNPKIVQYVDISTSISGFIQGQSYKVTFKSFSNGKTTLSKMNFDGKSSNFENNKQNGEFSSRSKIHFWRDHTASDISVSFKLKGMITQKLLFKINISLLNVKGNKLVLSKRELDNPIGIPEDFVMTIGFMVLEREDTQEQRDALFRTLENRFEKIRNDLKEKRFSESTLRVRKLI